MTDGPFSQDEYASCANTLKIIVATDNHLGVWEKDPIRQNDSFRSFEEVFQEAERERADMVLLGGDLFHHNKPSRETLIKACKIIEKYTFSQRSVKFEVVGGNFANGEKVNFAKSHLDIGLPVFTIHGNHDDPAGIANLSAIDVLSTNNLVNYFGKVPMGGVGVANIVVDPVLIRKGTTKVALYGLGNLRDERLGRMFKTPGCVQWKYPVGTNEGHDWFNILTLHQNRVSHGQAAKNVIDEDCLPEFLDFVVWGHEHECIPDTKARKDEKAPIIQPGSSVATALSEGEAKPKHIAVLEIENDQFRVQWQALRTVRPFKYDQVVLADQIELDEDDMQGVEKFLENKVQKMIDECNRRSSRDQDLNEESQLPLIRLRVDYTGFSTIRTQAFGNKFLNKLANPQDVLHWHKAPAKRALAEAGGQVAIPQAPPEQEGIATLVGQHVAGQLKAIPETDWARGLELFVEKDEKSALADQFNKVFDTLMDRMEDNLHSNIQEGIGEIAAKYSIEAEAAYGARSLEEVALPKSTVQPGEDTAEPAPKRTKGRAKKGDDEDDDDDLPAPTPAPKATGTRGTGRGRGRGRGRATTSRQTTLGETLAPKRKAAAAARISDSEDEEEDQPTTSKATRGTPRRQAAKKAQQKIIIEESEKENSDSDDVVDLDVIEDSDDEIELDPGPSKKRATGKLKLTNEPKPASKKRAVETSPVRTKKQTSVVSDDDDDIVRPTNITQKVGKRRMPGSLFGSQFKRK